jgi:septal ring factor EnvC (AmiA/AmiB activator)
MWGCDAAAAGAAAVLGFCLWAAVEEPHRAVLCLCCVLQAEREQLQEQLAAGAAEREEIQKKLQQVNKAGVHWKNKAEAGRKNVAQLEQQVADLEGKVKDLEAAAAAAAPAAAAGATDLQRVRQAAAREKKRADAAEKVGGRARVLGSLGLTCDSVGVGAVCG